MSVGGEDLDLGKQVLGVHRSKNFLQFTYIQNLRDVLFKDTLKKDDISKHRKNISYSIFDCCQPL